jgi:hypothetical protein
MRDIGDARLALQGAFEPRAAPASDRLAASPRGRRLVLVSIVAMIGVAVATAMIVRNLASGEEQPITFVIQPPPGVQFERRTMAPLPALSADGRQLAFVAPLDSKPVVWIQTLGELTARPLPGTEEASFPFWSPDSQFVGFSAVGRLKKVPVSGDGAPQELCTCDAPYSATWSVDGTVVFAGMHGLYRVSSAGGQPVAVTRVDESRGEFSHRFPFVLPDGRRFLYLVRSTKERSRGIFVGSLDEPALKRRLVPDESIASIGLDAQGRPYLFFVRDLALLAHRFDLARGELTGTAVVVARQVIPGEAGRFAPFAVARRALVYRRTTLSQTRLLWRDRRGVPGGIVGEPGPEYSFPALSPDGKRLAVGRRDPRTGRRDIWLIDLARGRMEKLTDDPVSAGFPLWAANGSRIFFASPRAGPWEVYSQSAHGFGEDERLRDAAMPAPERANPRDITSDGLLLFQGNRGLWMQPLDGSSAPHPLLAASHGRVSPDGRWLAYTAPIEGGTREVYVTTFPEPSRRWRISAAGGEDPQWRRDGSELFYVAGDSTLMAVAVGHAARTSSFDGVPSQVLFPAPFERGSLEFGSAYAPSADGQRFLLVESLRDEESLLVATMNWDGGGS